MNLQEIRLADLDICMAQDTNKQEGCCERGDGYSDYIKYGDWLTDCKLLDRSD